MPHRPVVTALQALVDDDRGAARSALTGDPSLLGRALSRFLDDDPLAGSVYDRPAAFAAFIRGGGNVALYEATSAALAAEYATHGVGALLDIGCGDGTALLPALTRRPVPRVDVVEPSGELLAATAAALAALSGITATTAGTTVQEFLGDLAPDRRWDLAESTFALHALAPGERTRVLEVLAGRVRRIAVVEFDVPDLPPRGPAALAFLADTYERGLAEYTADRDLVAQGFLMPVLVGQLAPGAVRSTWEQPAPAWAAQFAAAGFTDVAVRPVDDYWSSPAFLLTAAGSG
ncbi:class I SAM-dependent methyltransferase [Nakamurella deserti]|uniref:class I SAM-dependent methyltransferase n=1 Tax=Nakamurella deserti TaxID=2164074 RepID=UPI0013003E54|nr:class I SAM-dependent methyltransferase [Nakamurella deserti]